MFRLLLFQKLILWSIKGTKSNQAMSSAHGHGHGHGVFICYNLDSDSDLFFGLHELKFSRMRFAMDGESFLVGYITLHSAGLLSGYRS